MKFFIKRPFKYKGKTYSRKNKYIEMPYEDARKFVRSGKLMKSGDQVSEQPKEVKQNEEILEKTEPDAGSSVRSAGYRKRSRKSSK